MSYDFDFLLSFVEDNDKLMAVDKNSDLEYIMVVGIVCLSGIALLIIVSLGLMVRLNLFCKTFLCIYTLITL